METSLSYHGCGQFGRSSLSILDFWTDQVL